MPDDRDEDRDRDRDRDHERGIPTFYSIDKQLAVLSAEQREFRKTVEKRFDTIERRVEEAGSNYASRVDMDKVDAKVEKLKDSLYAYGKYTILMVIAAVVGLVLNKTGLPH